ncbi:MAG: hypothetical protein U5K76_11250 [Woeseiaceae bacterium]|nr:hypothetical protein [Woeseiaceae bacterium]
MQYLRRVRSSGGTGVAPVCTPSVKAQAALTTQAAIINRPMRPPRQLTTDSTLTIVYNNPTTA